jgi:hypothetical protein
MLATTFFADVARAKSIFVYCIRKDALFSLNVFFTITNLPLSIPLTDVRVCGPDGDAKAIRLLTSSFGSSREQHVISFGF